MYTTDDRVIGEMAGTRWPEPTVAMIGERDAAFNRVTSVLEEQSYKVVHHDAPGDVLVHLAEGGAAIEAKRAASPQVTVPTLLVFNCGVALDAWAPIFRASHLLLPSAAVLVFVRGKAWDVIRSALAAGADEVISADETKIRELVLARVRSALAKSLVAAIADPLRSAVACMPGIAQALSPLDAAALRYVAPDSERVDEIDLRGSEWTTRLAAGVHGGRQTLSPYDEATLYIAKAVAAGWRPTRHLFGERERGEREESGSRTREQDAGSRSARDVVEKAEPHMSASDAELARERVRAAASTLPGPEERAGPLAEVLGVRVPHLRSGSGRLDARKIAERLGVPLARLAGATPISRQALTATPDSARAQASLDPIARTISVLETLLPADRVSAWLNAPHPRLGSESPLVKILSGDAEQVARMLEVAREGGVD
jgi:hypothetical protein